jgi:hypothetical protein
LNEITPLNEAALRQRNRSGQKHKVGSSRF